MPTQLLTPEERRRKRCFHRVISGLEKGGAIRLITLTSSDAAVNPIQQDFRRLAMRLRRRGLFKDYIKVIEVKDDWREHIHLAFRGSHIDKEYLSHLWTILHQSPIVDIRRVKPGYKNKTGVASYLAKYMSKESARRYSWSWGWVYKGFVKVWKQALQTFRFWNDRTRPPIPFRTFLFLWRNHLRQRSPPKKLIVSITAQAF